MSELKLGPVVGGLTHQGAHLWGRAQQPGVLHAWVGQQPDLSDAYLAASSLPLDESNGYAGVAAVMGLQPDTRYFYSLTLIQTPPNSTHKDYPSFTTAPSPGAPQSFSFAFGSCFRPVDEHGGHIFSALEKRRISDDLRFVLLLGDQIYADAYRYNGIGKIACTLEDYRQVYAYTWSRPVLRNLLARLPAFMILDDHEVDDDWHWVDSSRRWATIPWWDRFVRWLSGRPVEERRIPLQRVQDALQAYWEHQGMHAPRFVQPPNINSARQYSLDTQDPGSLAYAFTFGASAFFVLDTRTMRVAGRGERTMLGDGQWEVLKTWLQAVKNAYPVKFLVTSCSMLHPMWHDIARDRWSGYPHERDRLLHYLAANDIQGVYFLAGDLHASHAVHAELYGPQGRSISLWEFCSTPFEQDPNWLARYTFSPMRSGPVRSSRREFSVSQNNFGVVSVEFSEDAQPRVAFQVVGSDGAVLGAAES